MISQEQNDRLTRVERGAPAGEVLRLYWQPAALVDELAGDRPVSKVRLFGEDLVLFRDNQGRYGLIDQYCPHRGADLGFGRCEDGGLRCTFHGWLMDAEGRCLDQPAEPVGSRFKDKIRVNAYPCVEKNGVIFTYMGPGDPPPFPDLDCFVAPEDHTFAFKGLWECNWLQAHEVGIDPAHASFLHRFFEDEDPAEQYGKQFRDEAADSGIPITRVLREFHRPKINVEPTDYGMRLVTLRQITDADMHVRVTNLVFPNAITIPMSREMIITQWHVPIDDHNTYWYSMFTSFGDVVDKDTMRAQRLENHTLPDYRPVVGRHNDYGFDPAEQAKLTYTGMGMDINVHDQWAVESPGAIQDRTKENLCRSDVAIIAFRRMLRRALDEVEAGSERPDLPMLVSPEQAHRIRGPVAVDAIGPADDWEGCWKERDAARRRASSWATSPWGEEG